MPWYAGPYLTSHCICPQMPSEVLAHSAHPTYSGPTCGAQLLHTHSEDAALAHYILVYFSLIHLLMEALAHPLTLGPPSPAHPQEPPCAPGGQVFSLA